MSTLATATSGSHNSTKHTNDDGTWVNVRAIPGTVGADLEALQHSRIRTKKIDALSQGVAEKLQFISLNLNDDWAAACAVGRINANRMAAATGIDQPVRPTQSEAATYSALHARVVANCEAAVHVSARIVNAAAIAFKAGIEYERAEAAAQKGSLLDQIERINPLIVFNPLFWNMSMIESAVELLKDDPEMGIWEKMQTGPILDQPVIRKLVGQKLMSVLRYGWQTVADEKGFSYSAAEEDLTVTEYGKQDHSTLDNALRTFRKNNAERQGEVVITKMDTPNGEAYLVSIPGTVSWSPNGWEHPLDLSSNVDTMYGEESTGMRYVKAAMNRAGIEPGSNVVLLGHSQGGIVASQLASESSFTDEYNVRALATANSPVGHNNIKPGIPALHLENQLDVVTALDKVSVPVSVDRTQIVGTTNSVFVDERGKTHEISWHDVDNSRQILNHAVQVDENARFHAGRIEDWMGPSLASTAYGIKMLDQRVSSQPVSTPQQSSTPSVAKTDGNVKHRSVAK